MFNWLHHLFNPHCEHCYAEKQCSNCETLKTLLESERYEKGKLVQQIIEITKPQVETVLAPKLSAEESKPQIVSWRVKRDLLESEDRAKAKIISDRKRVDDLEKQVGVNIPADTTTEQALVEEDKADAS